MNSIRWGKALLNGLLAWVIGFILYMIPSIIIAFRLVAEMGVQSQDPAAMSAGISERISNIYASSWLLTVGLIVVTGLLVFWRARVVAKGSHKKAVVNGLVVGAVPAALTLAFLACGGFGWIDIVAMLVYLGAGAAGGALARG